MKRYEKKENRKMKIKMKREKCVCIIMCVYHQFNVPIVLKRNMDENENKHENGQPTRKMTIKNKNARDDRAGVLRKVQNNDARGKKKAPR